MTGEDLEYKPGAVQKPKFAYSPSRKVFHKGLAKKDKKKLLKKFKNIEGKDEEQSKAMKYQEEKQSDAIKDQEEKKLDLIEKQNKNKLEIITKDWKRLLWPTKIRFHINDF